MSKSRIAGYALSTLLAAGLSMGQAAAAPKPGQDWLWLSASESACTWTITVTWSGFRKAKAVEVFVTEGYTGAPIMPTAYPIRGNDQVATVTVGPLAPSATGTYYYPWAQLLDAKGDAIPASLDFSGQSVAYCAAP